MSRSDWDWLLGPEDYQPGIADAIALAILCTVFAAAIDFTPWGW